MKLFGNDPSLNILPYDGTVNYYSSVIDLKESEEYFDLLLQTSSWQHDKLILFGKEHIMTRKVAWYGDDQFKYTYGSIQRAALPWIPILEELKSRIETITGEQFNSCLLNLYHNGSEGMGWHADNEPELGENPVIGSISFGAERKFVFKHRQSKCKASIILENGSVLLMKGKTQKFWLHTLPASKRIIAPRINLTFRTIKN